MALKSFVAPIGIQASGRREWARLIACLRGVGCHTMEERRVCGSCPMLTKTASGQASIAAARDTPQGTPADMTDVVGMRRKKPTVAQE